MWILKLPGLLLLIMEDVHSVPQHANLFSRSIFGRSGGTWKKGSVLKSDGGRGVSSGSSHDLAVVEVVD